MLCRRSCGLCSLGNRIINLVWRGGENVLRRSIIEFYCQVSQYICRPLSATVNLVFLKYTVSYLIEMCTIALFQCLGSFHWVLWQAYSLVQKFKEIIKFFGSVLSVILRDIRTRHRKFMVSVISSLFLSEKRNEIIK